MVSTSFGQLVNGELYHTDPYKISNLHYLDLTDVPKSLIIKSKIKSVSCFIYSLNKKLQQKGKGTPTDYSVVFNADGNPIKYKASDCTKNCDIYEYTFDYDSVGKLIHIRELILNRNSVRYDDVDIYFNYDNESKVVQEFVSQKHIYPPGYKYRGTPYSNDTFIFIFNIYYGKNKMVNSVVKYQSDYKSWKNVKEYDTLNYNCIFDSLFVKGERELSKDVKRDSVGNIVELIAYRYIHDKQTNDTQFVFKFEYDEQRRLIKKEMYNTRKELNDASYYDYNQDGLIYTEKYVDTKYRWMKLYHYEKY